MSVRPFGPSRCTQGPMPTPLRRLWPTSRGVSCRGGTPRSREAKSRPSYGFWTWRLKAARMWATANMLWTWCKRASPRSLSRPLAAMRTYGALRQGLSSSAAAPTISGLSRSSRIAPELRLRQRGKRPSPCGKEMIAPISWPGRWHAAYTPRRHGAATLASRFLVAPTRSCARRPWGRRGLFSIGPTSDAGHGLGGGPLESAAKRPTSRWVLTPSPPEQRVAGSAWTVSLLLGPVPVANPCAPHPA